MQYAKVQQATDTFKKLFLENWVISVGLSGKDSICVAHCAVEGLKQAMEVNPYVGPLYIVTTNTTIENLELHGLMLDLHQAARKYGREHGLPIRTEELEPSLASLPMVEYVGRGKLLRTPVTSKNGRDCTVDWKIEPMKRYLRALGDRHQTNKIASASGTRDLESKVRAANIAKRNESDVELVKTDLGFTFAPIKSWTLTDVWALSAAIDNDAIESFAVDHTYELKKHYGAGNGGTCDLFSGENKDKDKSCGSRFGCFLCAMVERDESLEAQISISPARYGYMAPFSELRTFMVNTLFDYERSRALVGREVKAGGWVLVGYNQYSLDYRQELLRYILTIDVQEQEAFYEQYGYEGCRFQLIGYKELLMIQYQWAREGGESEVGTALRIWHSVYTDGERYAIPKTQKAEPQTLPATRYFNINGLVKQHACTGLHEDNRHNILTNQLWMHPKLDSVDLVPFEEEQRHTIDCESCLIDDLVERWWPEVLEEGHFGEGVCPTVIIKLLLEAKILKLKRGSIPGLHKEVQRAQVYNALKMTYGVPYDTMVLGASLSEAEYKAALAEQEQAEAVLAGQGFLDLTVAKQVDVSMSELLALW
ncbi:hypothetical protein ACM257_21055 [Alteromonas macleodii]|uniref:hypothetical protein n=1 Tax=Alteromonas macleodii TaxID=28108 RepID=UPI0039F6E450